MKHVIRDLAYHVEIDGDGPPLLLLHGFTGSTDNWEPLLPRLCQAHTVVRVDLPGHGQTALPEDVTRYNMPSTAQDLSLLLHELHFSQVTLWGYSLGARLALFFALHYSAQVRHLLLESGSPGLADEAERIARRANDEALAQRIERNGIGAFVQEWEHLPMWDSQSKLSVVERQRIHEQRLRNRPVGLANSLRQIGTGAQPSLWSQLSELHILTGFVAGADDSKFVRIAQQMQSHCPAAYLNIVPQAGHAVHLEQSQSVIDVLLNLPATGST